MRRNGYLGALIQKSDPAICSGYPDFRPNGIMALYKFRIIIIIIINTGITLLSEYIFPCCSDYFGALSPK